MRFGRIDLILQYTSVAFFDYPSYLYFLAKSEIHSKVLRSVENGVISFLYPRSQQMASVYIRTIGKQTQNYRALIE